MTSLPKFTCFDELPQLGGMKKGHHGLQALHQDAALPGKMGCLLPDYSGSKIIEAFVKTESRN